MRNNHENGRFKNIRVEGALLSDVMIPPALGAAAAMVEGMPYAVGYDAVSTARVITMYTPAVAAVAREHEIWNISSGTAVLTINSPAAAALGTLAPGQSAKVRWFNGAWSVFKRSSGTSTQTTAAKTTFSLYSTLALLVNTQVMAIKMPFAGTLDSIGFRTRAPATTGSKAATLTAQIGATPVTGGVLSLTSANMTPTNTRVSSTAITALNTFAAGDNIGALISAVTAFSEGDGYLEFDVTNTDLRA